MSLCMWLYFRCSTKMMTMMMRTKMSRENEKRKRDAYTEWKTVKMKMRNEDETRYTDETDSLLLGMTHFILPLLLLVLTPSLLGVKVTTILCSSLLRGSQRDSSDDEIECLQRMTLWMSDAFFSFFRFCVHSFSCRSFTFNAFSCLYFPPSWCSCLPCFGFCQAWLAIHPVFWCSKNGSSLVTVHLMSAKEYFTDSILPQEWQRYWREKKREIRTEDAGQERHLSL